MSSSAMKLQVLIFANSGLLNSLYKNMCTEEADCAVQKMNSAEEALKWCVAEEASADLILMDYSVNIDTLDGPSATRLLREKGVDTTIVGIGPEDGLEYRKTNVVTYKDSSLVADGFDYYYPKLMSTKELKLHISRIQQENKVREQMSASKRWRILVCYSEEDQSVARFYRRVACDCVVTRKWKDMDQFVKSRVIDFVVIGKAAENITKEFRAMGVEVLEIPISTSRKPLVAAHFNLLQDLMRRMSARKEPSVLVVADYQTSQSIDCILRKDFGCEVHIAKDGEEADNYFKAGKNFDLVLLDMDMAIMDSPKVTEKLREIGVESMIVGVSSRDIEQEKSALIASGFDDFHGKPFNVNTAKCILQQVTSQLILLKNKAANKNVSVLLAGHDPFIKRFCKQMGVKIDTANSAEEAVVLCGEGVFHLMLMEESMSIKNGSTIIAEVREEKVKSMIVAITSRDRVPALNAAGFDGFLIKPFTVDTLASLIQQVIFCVVRSRIYKDPS